jgi:hypothetical protein
MMTIDDFRVKIKEMAQGRVVLEGYRDFLQQKTRPDKYLREEYLPILAVVDHQQLPGSEQIELGDEKQGWDARVGETTLFEVVQALPEKEYEIRNAVAVGQAGPVTQFAHAGDHLQFAEVIIRAIDSKHAKNYTDQRSLIVSFDGDYSFEDDEVIRGWVRAVRQRTTRGAFKEILLVELSRRKVFPVFEATPCMVEEGET